MKIECDNATKFAEEKFKYVKEYFSQNREKQEKNETKHSSEPNLQSGRR